MLIFNGDYVHAAAVAPALFVIFCNVTQTKYIHKTEVTCLSNTCTLVMTDTLAFSQGICGCLGSINYYLGALRL